MVSLLVNGTDVFTGDTLFRGSVGGVRAPGHTTYADLKASIMETLLTLPPQTGSTRVTPNRRPSPTSSRTTRSSRIWRGPRPRGRGPCTALGEPATLILLGDDYDGGHKAWVRWPDGTDDIVPGLAGDARTPPGPEDGVAVADGSKIPKSRVRRTAKIGGLAAGQAMRQAGTIATNVARTQGGPRGRARAAPHGGRRADRDRARAR